MSSFNCVVSGMQNTWDVIGMDVLEVSGTDYVPRDVVIEMVLDAGRLEMYGHCDEKELKIFNELIWEEKQKLAYLAFPKENYGY